MAVTKSGQHLDDAVSKKLLREMTSGKFAKVRNLPPESELCKKYGVSRPVIRAALGKLEREGFVSRKHGVGTVVNHHVIRLNTRMDMEKEFLELIKDAGYTAKVIGLSVTESPARADEAKQLAIEEGSGLIRFSRIFTANEKPAIWCEDSFSKQLLIKSPVRKNACSKPDFYILDHYCKKNVHLALTELKALSAEEELAEKLAVSKGDAVLCMDEIGYEIDGTPLLKSRQYYVNGILPHTILRKKI